MEDFKGLYKEIEQQIVSLAESTVSNYKEEAIKDAKKILADMKVDLIRWTDLLALKQIKVNEFEWLVNRRQRFRKPYLMESNSSQMSHDSTGSSPF